MAAVAANTHEVFREAGGDDFLGDGETRTHYFETLRYLEYVAADIRQSGWVSRSVAEDLGRISTADSAMTGMHRDMQLEPADKELAAAALTWAMTIPDEKTAGNDFLHNISVVAKMEAITIRQRGMAAAIVRAYQKDMEDGIEKSGTKPSVHQGTVGERAEFRGLTLESVHPFEGGYGMTYLHHFQDADGNQFKWFASSNNMEVGKVYDLTATVKKHDEYKGVQQTILTRAKEGVKKPSKSMAKALPILFMMAA